MRLAILLTTLLVTAVTALQWKCSDFSSVINLESSGRTYRDNGQVKPLETILASKGQNLARIRIWTSTSDSQYSLNYALRLARRARAAGMSIYVDLHYSDTWADPSKQAIPSAWPKDLAGLNNQIWTYTRDVVLAFQNQGTPITMISIGNEINDGFLWPVGKISVNGYDGLSQLLHSAAQGVRAASGSVRIMVHLANGWNNSVVSGFWRNIFRQGQFATSDYDIMGYSMYPFYESQATIGNLRTAMTNIVNSQGKDLMVVETDWPGAGTCNGQGLTANYPISPAGQQSWVSAIRDVVAGLPNGRGIGLCYWEPAWIGNAGLGSKCDDNLLVDGSGNTRASINMFSQSM